ncbi:MAG: heat-inducible transcriptional repressor HrcA [Gammaproteobacteria bacterium]|nr:heat-inducible transcriptional repressor HrcA [Gammaproteobacteria bacterium]
MSRTPRTVALQLSERSLILFRALVEHFIHGGLPVGSRTLARDTGLDLSPATIRNVMADLEDMGLVQSPHTSAGRVPTVRGYRLFVDSLLRMHTLGAPELQRIARELDRGESVQMLMQLTSSMLSEVTQLAGIVMLPRAAQQSLRQIEFVALGDNRVLVILVVNEHEIQNRIIQTARPYKPSELQQAANYLNSLYSGRDLQAVRTELLGELKRMKEDVNSIMQTAIEIAQKAFDVGEPAKGDYVLSGQTNLMGVTDLLNVDKLRRLFESFNRKRDILHLLEQAINARGVQIFIGEESGYEVLENCSVVTSPYEVEGEILGVLGVIGPTRMDYERVIPIVDVTAKMLGSALNSLT